MQHFSQFGEFLSSSYRVGLWAQANCLAQTFKPAHKARAGQRAALYVTKNAQHACGNFHACAFTKFQKPQQLRRADSMLIDRHVTCFASRVQSQRPALLQAAAETTTGKEDLKATRRVRNCKEVGLQEYATVPLVLYGIGLRMSLRRRTILSKRLRAPARVALTIHTFRTVDRTAGRRFVREEIRIW